ncbi:MAG: hypothetical protein WBP59_05110 [Ilumatobacteraceae bacterium]
MNTAMRRTILLVLIAAFGGAALTWWRDRTATPTPAAPPEWPPIPSSTPAPAAASPAPSAGAAAGPARSTPATSWVAPNADGTCPDGHPVKAKETSGIYHVPGGRFYERTNPDRCYASPEDAVADGYRPSKS